AVQVEDHPIAYNQFEGVIPKGQYGAGDVIIWDEGTWTPVGDARAGLAEGHLKFDLDGYKLKGRWALVKMKNAEGSKPVWLLIKDRDSFAKRKNDFDVVEALPDSIVPLRSAKAAVKKPAASHGAVKKAKTRETVVKKAATGKAAASAAATGKSVAKKTATLRDELPGKALKKLPETLAPQLATLVDQAPPNPTEWLYEIKFDGYRITARIDSDGIRLFTRNGHDWTHKLPHIVQALSALDMDLSWLDGEIVIMDKKGAPDFGALQNAFDSDQTADIIYFVFDAPIIAGRDMRQESLDVRRALVEQAVHALGSDVVRFSQAFDVPADQLVKSACQMGLEGVIAKRRDSIYVSRRSPTWVKLKCTRRQEFVIVGFTKPKGSRSGLGALLLAVHDDDGALRYVGNVGSGFNDTTLATVSRALKAMQTDEPALKVPADAARGATWVTPAAVAEVSFSDWTSAGRIRHGVFRGLRTDKPASAITKETPQNASTSAKSLGSSTSRKSSTSPRPPASSKAPTS
ncbi:MAG: ATP-dependent DNA ligase, partial [Comamonadaceae bacterium]